MRQAGKFQESPARFAFKFEPNQEQVSDQGGPDLDEHGILGSAVKGLDLQVLLDPLEKELSGKGWRGALPYFRSVSSPSP